MKLQSGSYRTEFSQDGTWNTYYKDNLIAVANENMWKNTDVEFSSKHAGELLLQTTMEITASLDNILILDHAPEVILEPELGMEKTTEGDTQDVESPSEKIHEEDVPKSEENIIMIKIQSILDDAVLAQASGMDIKLLFQEIDEWKNRFNSLQASKLKNEYNTLLKRAEKDLSEDIDCTATLNRIEEIVKVLNGQSK